MEASISCSKPRRENPGWRLEIGRIKWGKKRLFPIQMREGFGCDVAAAGIDEATPQGSKRQPAQGRQSDARSYCRPWAGPFSICGVAQKARLPPPKNRETVNKKAPFPCKSKERRLKILGQRPQINC